VASDPHESHPFPHDRLFRHHHVRGALHAHGSMYNWAGASYFYTKQYRQSWRGWFRPAEEVFGRSRISQLLCPSKTVVGSREGVGINVINRLRWKSDKGLFRRPD
jgi:hypothetical protein